VCLIQSDVVITVLRCRKCNNEHVLDESATTLIIIGQKPHNKRHTSISAATLSFEFWRPALKSKMYGAFVAARSPNGCFNIQASFRFRNASNIPCLVVSSTPCLYLSQTMCVIGFDMANQIGRCKIGVDFQSIAWR
jgi:ribosomal protein S27E